MSKQTIQSTGCCEPFDPTSWDNKKIVWKNKLFVKDHIISFLHIPLNFGSKVTQNMRLIEKANVTCQEQLMLTDETSLWGADIYIAVSQNVPAAQMSQISGTFVTKVFEGPYEKIGEWVKEMKQFVQTNYGGFQKMLFWYTTCPKCAKTYGKNYVVIFAQIDD